MNKKLIIALGLLSAVAVGTFYFLTTSEIGTEYNTVQVKKGKMEKYVEDVGQVSSQNIRNYYANEVKKVEKLPVEIGDSVKEDQVLLRFEETSDIEIKKVNKQIEALEASYNEALSGADFEAINGIKIEISAIKSQIEQAIKNKNRIEKLYNNQAVAKVELETAQNNLDALENDLALARNRYNKLAKGLSDNLKKKYEAEIDVLLLTLEQLKDAKKDAVLKSDVEGIVTDVNTFEGDVPPVGTKILEVQGTLEKIISIDFMTEDALLIEPGMKALVKDETLDIEINDLKVLKLHPKAFITLSELSVEENRQTVEIGPIDTSENLPIGLELESKVMVLELKDVLFVPKDAIYEKNGGEYVKLLKDGEPIDQQVIIGTINDNTVQIKEGLKEGDEVIIDYEENEE